MTEITRKWLEEQVSLTWTDDVSEWYRNSSELITNILNSLETSYIIKEVHTKELVPHAHTFDCKDWKTCDCPIISPFKVGNKVTCSDHDQRLWRIQVIKDDGLVLVEVNPERPGNPQWRYRVKPESCSLVNDFSDWPNNDRDK